MRRGRRDVDSPMGEEPAMSFPIELLRCPISAQSLTPASEGLVRALQQLQGAGTLRNRAAVLVEPFEAGLLSENGGWFYPVRSGIPVMLAAEAVARADFSGSPRG
jgi:uncharacterized protein YbaR (Trm112 family)